jgi:hypothetical protein
VAGFDHGRFYRFGEGFMRGSLRARPDPALFDSAFPLARGEATLDAPGRFTYDEGTRARDIVGTTYPPLKLVSDRLVGALAGFTGWTTYPVELTGRDGEPLPGYHGFAVTGRLVEPDDWDGSDVFVTGEGALTFVSEPVRDALLAAGVKNVRLERAGA